MENDFNYLYEFVMFLLDGFKDTMSDLAFAQLVNGVTICIVSVFVAGIISATWGACGALACLRRSKRG